MSVGIIDTRTNPSQLNAVEFLWDPAKRTSAFIQVWIFTSLWETSLTQLFTRPWWETVLETWYQFVNVLFYKLEGIVFILFGTVRAGVA